MAIEPLIWTEFIIKCKFENNFFTIPWQLDSLKPKESLVIRQRYGLDGKGDRTLGEIAGNLSISREMVRKHEMKALMKLKHPTRVDYLQRHISWIKLARDAFIIHGTYIWYVHSHSYRLIYCDTTHYSVSYIAFINNTTYKA